MHALLDHRPLRMRDFLAGTGSELPELTGVGLHVVSLEKTVPVLGALHDLLDPWEQEQARAIANRNRRTAHIASRALVRLALSEYSGKMVRPETWRFTTNAYGKLTLAQANRRRLSFPYPTPCRCWPSSCPKARRWGSTWNRSPTGPMPT
jgi:hypothetical protein